MQEHDYYLAFSYSPIGPRRFLLLLAYFKTAENVWFGTQEEYAKFGIVGKTYDKFEEFRQKFDSDTTRALLESKSVMFISQADEYYPQELFDLPDVPIGLFVKGDVSCLLASLKVAIVGTRKITSYGHSVTELFARGLASSGICIVSGMAMGVDGVAHRATLGAQGKTIAVLGNGVDLPIPRENMSLYVQIIEHSGAIISEYPPGTPSNKGSFLARNRIIAALSAATLVTEASKDSGSLVTAAHAHSLGRKVFAVPGPITSSQSAGSVHLLKEGAGLVSDPRELLSALDVQEVFEAKKDLSGLAERELKVMEVLVQEATSLDELSKKCNIPISELSQIVTGLELTGFVNQDGQGKIAAV